MRRQHKQFKTTSTRVGMIIFLSAIMWFFAFWVVGLTWLDISHVQKDDTANNNALNSAIFQFQFRVALFGSIFGAILGLHATTQTIAKRRDLEEFLPNAPLSIGDVKSLFIVGCMSALFGMSCAACSKVILGISRDLLVERLLYRMVSSTILSVVAGIAMHKMILIICRR